LEAGTILWVAHAGSGRIKAGGSRLADQGWQIKGWQIKGWQIKGWQIKGWQIISGMPAAISAG
jgi:hypothetical protein